MIRIVEDSGGEFRRPNQQQAPGADPMVLTDSKLTTMLVMESTWDQLGAMSSGQIRDRYEWSPKEILRNLDIILDLGILSLWYKFGI